MDLERVRSMVASLDGRFVLLIVLCGALLLTIQAVEGSVEGLWPHQRRLARMAPAARAVQGVWSWVALLLLPGILLATLNLAILMWRGQPHAQVHALGGFFVGLAWVMFIAVSFNLLGLGRFITQVGPAGPAALLVLLLAGDILLLLALLDILPSFETMRAVLPLVGERAAP